MTTTIDVAALCHWTANRADIQHEQPDHGAYHYGSACPYRVVAAVLNGQPDPRDAIEEWRLPLPFRDNRPPMSLNDRYAHFAIRANRVDGIKKLVRAAVIAAKVPVLDHVHVEFHYRPKANLVRDADNLVATLKPCIDAIHQPFTHDPAWHPIVRGDDARYVSWTPPVLHPANKRLGPACWLVLRGTP